jgi:hypothetical protein
LKEGDEGMKGEGMKEEREGTKSSISFTLEYAY